MAKFKYRPDIDQPHIVSEPEDVVVNHMDCVAGLSRLPDGYAQLIFADPPFNIGRDYDVCDDKKSNLEYLAWSRTWIEQVYRVLDPHGSFWLSIGNKYVSELDVMCKSEFGLHSRGPIRWYYSFGVNCARNFTRSHTNLLYYTKHKTKFTFNEDDLRLPSARQVVYQDKRANPAGRLPDDTWIIRPQSANAGFAPGDDVQHFPRVCGTYNERCEVDNQYPEQLIARIVRVSSNAGDMIIDPFCGSGTTVTVSKKLGRRCMTYDISPGYAMQAKLRLESAKAGDMLDSPEPPAPAKGKKRQL